MAFEKKPMQILKYLAFLTFLSCLGPCLDLRANKGSPSYVLILVDDL